MILHVVRAPLTKAENFTVKECTRHSRRKSRSANIHVAWGMQFEACHQRLWMAVGPMAEISLPALASPLNAKEK